MMPLEPGTFGILRGAPGAGKTELALQAALFLAENHRVGYLTLDTTCSKLAERLMLLPAAREQRLDKVSLDLVSACGMTAQDMEDFVLSANYQIVFVDYLQLIPPFVENRNDRERNNAIALHRLSQSHGVTVFALSLSAPSRQKGGGLSE